MKRRRMMRRGGKDVVKIGMNYSQEQELLYFHLCLHPFGSRSKTDRFRLWFHMPVYGPLWQYFEHKYQLWGDCSQQLSEWLDSIPERETKAIALDTEKPKNLRWIYNMQTMTQAREERETENHSWRITSVKQIRRILMPYAFSHAAEQSQHAGKVKTENAVKFS